MVRQLRKLQGRGVKEEGGGENVILESVGALLPNPAPAPAAATHTLSTNNTQRPPPCRFMFLWLSALPWSMWPDAKWAVVPITGVVSYLLLGIGE